jgi:hypothetical protein
VRETFESALEFGRAALEALGLTPERAVDVRDYVRKRDLERLGLQQVEGITAGRELIYARMVQPEPLSIPPAAMAQLSIGQPGRLSRMKRRCDKPG